MSAFDAALATLFNDPNLGTDATFTPAGGTPVALRAVLTRGVLEDVALGRTGFRLAAADQATAVFADIRASDVAAPKKGNSLSVGDITYPVTAEPELDQLRLSWRLTLGEPS